MKSSWNLPPQQPPAREKERTPRWNVSAATVEKEGKNREQNEDAVLAHPQEGVFAVLDGMGGHDGGREASQAAKKYIEGRIHELPDGLSLQETATRMDRILRGANEDLLRIMKENPSLYNMGTTVSLVKIWKGPNGEQKIIAGNIGDSRVSLLKANGTLVQVTIDDSFRREGRTEEQVRAIQKRLSEVSSADQLPVNERDFFIHRNWITQYLGMSGIEPRMFVTDFEVGDKVILTTDGVHDNLRSVDIASAIRASRDGQDDATKLVSSSLLRSKNGAMMPRAKDDDMSAVVVEYPQAERESMTFEEAVSGGVEMLRSSRLAKLIAGFVAIAGIGKAVYEVEQAIVHREPVVDTVPRSHDPSIERTEGEKVYKKPTGPVHVNPKKPTKKKK